MPRFSQAENTGLEEYDRSVESLTLKAQIKKYMRIFTIFKTSLTQNIDFVQTMHTTAKEGTEQVKKCPKT